jgi:hypothetical protein
LKNVFQSFVMRTEPTGACGADGDDGDGAGCDGIPSDAGDAAGALAGGGDAVELADGAPALVSPPLVP